MIRKIIIVVLMALFAHELFQLLFNDVQPNIDLMKLAYATAIYLLGRLMVAILLVEHLTAEIYKNAGMGKD